MAIKEILKVLKWMLIVILVLVGLWFLDILMEGFGITLVREPYDYENTIWECEEADIYFITDSHRNCMGEASVDSGHVFFCATWIHEIETFNFKEIAVDETGRSVVPYPCNDFSTIVSYPASGEYVCWTKHIKVTVEPEKFHLWETDEPVTLTFVCRGKVPEVDLYSGADPICRMEVIGRSRRDNGGKGFG